jgi:hypothetical protein
MKWLALKPYSRSAAIAVFELAINTSRMWTTPWKLTQW